MSRHYANRQRARINQKKSYSGFFFIFFLNDFFFFSETEIGSGRFNTLPNLYVHNLGGYKKEMEICGSFNWVYSFSVAINSIKVEKGNSGLLQGSSGPGVGEGIDWVWILKRGHPRGGSVNVWKEEVHVRATSFSCILNSLSPSLVLLLYLPYGCSRTLKRSCGVH